MAKTWLGVLSALIFFNSASFIILILLAILGLMFFFAHVCKAKIISVSIFEWINSLVTLSPSTINFLFISLYFFKRSDLINLILILLSINHIFHFELQRYYKIVLTLIKIQFFLLQGMLLLIACN